MTRGVNPGEVQDAVCDCGAHYRRTRASVTECAECRAWRVYAIGGWTPLTREEWRAVRAARAEIRRTFGGTR